MKGKANFIAILHYENFLLDPSKGLNFWFKTMEIDAVFDKPPLYSWNDSV